jgi:hypothetical protein
MAKGDTITCEVANALIDIPGGAPGNYLPASIYVLLDGVAPE